MTGLGERMTITPNQSCSYAFRAVIEYRIKPSGDAFGSTCPPDEMREVGEKKDEMTNQLHVVCGQSMRDTIERLELSQ